MRRCSRPPTPGVQPPYPRPIFSSLPPPHIFPFFSGTPAQNSDFLPPPTAHLPHRPPPPPIFRQKKTTPVPLTPDPRPPCPPPHLQIHIYHLHDDVIKWTHFSFYWPFVRGTTGDRWFPSQRPVTWSFDVFFDLRLNKRLNKQSRRR